MRHQFSFNSNWLSLMFDVAILVFKHFIERQASYMHRPSYCIYGGNPAEGYMIFRFFGGIGINARYGTAHEL